MTKNELREMLKCTMGGAYNVGHEHGFNLYRLHVGMDLVRTDEGWGKYEEVFWDILENYLSDLHNVRIFGTEEDQDHRDAPSKPERKSTTGKWIAGRIAEDRSGVIVHTIGEDFQRLRMFNSEAEALRDVFSTFYVDDEHIAFSAKVEVHD